MTSQINYGAITTSYPVAGEDNDSQGFRDNFTAIAAGLAQAKIELTQLQNSSVLRADLATNTTAVQNDLNGSTIANAFYNKFYGVFYNGGNHPVSADINLVNGPMQRFNLSGDSPTLRFKGWPASGHATVKVAISTAVGSKAARQPIFATDPGGTIRYDTAFPLIPKNSGDPEYGIRVGGERLVSITVDNQGSGYTATAYPTGVTVALSGISGSFTPTIHPTYIIKSPTVESGGGGAGYTTGDIVVVNENPNVQLTVTANAGEITAVTVVGSTGTLLPQLFQEVTNVTAITGDGTGGKVNLPCGIDSIRITNAGDAFLLTTPSLVINSLNKTQAIADNALGGTNAYGVAVITSSDPALPSEQYNIKIIEATSFDGGENVFLKYIGEFPTV
jgi:hypothetical protein